MIQINYNFIVDPREYKTWVGFVHDFCKGCAYENGTFGHEEDERVSKCYGCINILDRLYKDRKPLFVTKNEKGKNIVMSD